MGEMIYWEVYLWLIDVDICETPTQSCKALILQVKNYLKNKKNHFDI